MLVTKPCSVGQGWERALTHFPGVWSRTGEHFCSCLRTRPGLHQEPAHLSIWLPLTVENPGFPGITSLKHPGAASSGWVPSEQGMLNWAEQAPLGNSSRTPESNPSAVPMCPGTRAQGSETPAGMGTPALPCSPCREGIVPDLQPEPAQHTWRLFPPVLSPGRREWELIPWRAHLTHCTRALRNARHRMQTSA